MVTHLRKGFTLIELLVVIAIIAILSTVGLTAFTNAQRGGRDAKRRSDMKDAQTAFEQWYATNGNVYSNAGCVMTTFLQGTALPQDPKNSGIYTYTCTNASNAAYTYCAAMENLGTGNSTNATGNFTTPGAGVQGYFCVRNLQ